MERSGKEQAMLLYICYSFVEQRADVLLISSMYTTKED